MFYLSSMANCGSNLLILKSIEELRAKKKRPDHESVVSHAQRLHGLSIKDGRESLCYLLNNGSVFNRPTSAGLISLFVSEESNNTITASIFNTSQDETMKKSYSAVSDQDEVEAQIDALSCNQRNANQPDITSVDIDEVCYHNKPQSGSRWEFITSNSLNDSFLCFLDGVKTPPKGKDTGIHNFTVGNSNASSLLGIIQTLVDCNATLNNTIENERSCNSKLAGEILYLRLQIQKMSTDVCSQGPTLKVIGVTQARDSMNQTSGIDSVEQRLSKQLKDVQKLKHEEFISLKSAINEEHVS